LEKEPEFIAGKNALKAIPLLCNQDFEKLCWQYDSFSFYKVIQKPLR
jgi:hypothetical protein